MQDPENMGDHDHLLSPDDMGSGLVFISSKCFISSKASFHPSLHFIQLGILDEMRHLDEMKLLDEMKHHNFGPREKW